MTWHEAFRLASCSVRSLSLNSETYDTWARQSSKCAQACLNYNRAKQYPKEYESRKPQASMEQSRQEYLSTMQTSQWLKSYHMTSQDSYYEDGSSLTTTYDETGSGSYMEITRMAQARISHLGHNYSEDGLGSSQACWQAQRQHSKDADTQQLSTRWLCNHIWIPLFHGN